MLWDHRKIIVVVVVVAVVATSNNYHKNHNNNNETSNEIYLNHANTGSNINKEVRVEVILVNLGKLLFTIHVCKSFLMNCLLKSTILEEHL